jgi:hypothetical protein
MELTDEMLEEIRRNAKQVEYGKVVIEIDSRGSESPVDIVSTITARSRFQRGVPTVAKEPRPRIPGKGFQD